MSFDLTDDGYIDATINGVKQRLDLYETHNAIFELTRALQGKPLREFHAGLVALLVEKGFPECSHRLASLFQQHIAEVVDDLKNGDGASPRPGLRASTAPASSEPIPTPQAA